MNIYAYCRHNNRCSTPEDSRPVVCYDKHMYKALRITLVLMAVLGICFGISTRAAALNVNNFEITDYQIDYYLSKGEDGRSTLRTEETIKAVFPDYDQNHGIERAVPSSYDGHRTSLQFTSVTDGANQKRAYSSRTENGLVT